MGGWWGEYNFRCQPVDYTNSDTANRVSFMMTPQSTFSKNKFQKLSSLS